jgi:hypothetical protein
MNAADLPTTPPSLSLQSYGTELVLSWADPTFSLQSAVDPTGPFSLILGATSPYTNTIGPGQQFFRLVK